MPRHSPYDRDNLTATSAEGKHMYIPYMKKHSAHLDTTSPLTQRCRRAEDKKLGRRPDLPRTATDGSAAWLTRDRT